uniref:Kazal-like domain-containing protein n=1 Tax=Oryzias sinensis TaxID=183150 RepID=A0A8C7YBM9_9TELE
MIHVFVFIDPCKDAENSLNVLCRVEALTRRPLLYSPPESCPPDDDPLCASDGHTYPNECHMTSRWTRRSLDCWAGFWFWFWLCF